MSVDDYFLSLFSIFFKQSTPHPLDYDKVIRNQITVTANLYKNSTRPNLIKHATYLANGEDDGCAIKRKRYEEQKPTASCADLLVIGHGGCRVEWRLPSFHTH